MIAEDLLERGLLDAASEYDVPSEAPAHIREQLMSSAEDNGDGARRRQMHRPSPRGWLVMAAAALVVIVIASFAVGGGGGSSNNLDTASGPSAGAGATAGGGTVAGSRLSRDAAKTARQGRTTVAGATPAPVVRAHTPAFAAPTGSSGATTAGGTTTDSFDAAKGPIAPVPSAPDKVIKTGTLDLQVPKGKVGPTLDQVTGIATLERGYIANSRTSEGGGAP